MDVPEQSVSPEQQTVTEPVPSTSTNSSGQEARDLTRALSSDASASHRVRVTDGMTTYPYPHHELTFINWESLLSSREMILMAT